MCESEGDQRSSHGAEGRAMPALIGLLLAATMVWGCADNGELLVPPATNDAAVADSAQALTVTADSTRFAATTRAPQETDPELVVEGFQVPVAFRAECQYLRSLEEAPADLTTEDFVACLDTTSRRHMANAYSRRYASSREAPRDLDEYLDTYGRNRVRDGSIREVLEGPRTPVAVTLEGIEPIGYKGGVTSGPYGLDPSTCSVSCLSETIPVVNGWRTIGYRASFSGPGNNPGDARQLDSIDFGRFPDLRQANLSNSELRSTGCGPVAGVNLYEWWGMPVWQGSTQHTSLNARTEYFADRMDTLQGINFTDDEELIDFLIDYPRELYNAGRISGYPGAHYRMDDPSGFKALLSYVSQGHPVIALYSTGSESLHWALITGYTGGYLRIANGTDRTLSDFYNQWDDWEALSWYADWASELYVDKDTFFAYTGWASSTGVVEPERFRTRYSLNSTPGYNYGSTFYGFRYCLPGFDEIGNQAESKYFQDWSSEYSPSSPGYCMLNSPVGSPSLAPTPTNNRAWLIWGGVVTLSAGNTSGMQNFIANNPGARCSWYGQRQSGAWTHLSTNRCNASGALSYTFDDGGDNLDITSIKFFVHSPDFLQTTWSLSRIFLIRIPVFRL